MGSAGRNALRRVVLFMDLGGGWRERTRSGGRFAPVSSK
jgi:hypothetical protein